MSLKREPVAIVAAIVGVVEAAIPMLIALGYLDWSTEQTAAVMAFVIALGTVAGIVVMRYLVTPVAEPRDRDGTPLVAAPSPDPSHQGRGEITNNCS